jgi:hypothetical protein
MRLSSGIGRWFLVVRLSYVDWSLMGRLGCAIRYMSLFVYA